VIPGRADIQRELETLGKDTARLTHSQQVMLCAYFVDCVEKARTLSQNPEVRAERVKARRARLVRHGKRQKTEQRAEYQAYIQSPEWRERRTVAIQGAGGRCQLCNRSDALHVHHRTYKRFGAEMEDDLTVLCKRCHEHFHAAGIVPGRVA